MLGTPCFLRVFQSPYSKKNTGLGVRRGSSNPGSAVSLSCPFYKMGVVPLMIQEKIKYKNHFADYKVLFMKDMHIYYSYNFKSVHKEK